MKLINRFLDWFANRIDRLFCVHYYRKLPKFTQISTEIERWECERCGKRIYRITGNNPND